MTTRSQDQVELLAERHPSIITYRNVHCNVQFLSQDSKLESSWNVDCDGQTSRSTAEGHLADRSKAYSTLFSNKTNIIVLFRSIE